MSHTTLQLEARSVRQVHTVSWSLVVGEDADMDVVGCKKMRAGGFGTRRIGICETLAREDAERL